jgi:hypothetical protein
MWVDEEVHYISYYKIFFSSRGQRNRYELSNIDNAMVFERIEEATKVAKTFNMNVYVYSVNEGEN